MLERYVVERDLKVGEESIDLVMNFHVKQQDGKPVLQDRDWHTAYKGVGLQDGVEPSVEEIQQEVYDFYADSMIKTLAKNPDLLPTLESIGKELTIWASFKKQGRFTYEGVPQSAHELDRICFGIPVEGAVVSTYQGRETALEDEVIHEFTHHKIYSLEVESGFDLEGSLRQRTLARYVNKLKHEGLTTIRTSGSMQDGFLRSAGKQRGLKWHLMDFAEDKMSHEEFSEIINPYLYSFGGKMVYTMGVAEMGLSKDALDKEPTLPDEIRKKLLSEVGPMTPSDFVTRYEQACDALGISDEMDEHGFPIERVLTSKVYNTLQDRCYDTQ